MKWLVLSTDSVRGLLKQIHINLTCAYVYVDDICLETWMPGNVPPERLSLWETSTWFKKCWLLKSSCCNNPNKLHCNKILFRTSTPTEKSFRWQSSHTAMVSFITAFVDFGTIPSLSSIDINVDTDRISKLLDGSESVKAPTRLDRPTQAYSWKIVIMSIVKKLNHMSR